jgi:glucosamine-6-phosphate deaminase
MKLIICNSELALAKRVSKILLNEIKNNPSIKIGVASGKTFIPIYKDLVFQLNKNKKNISKLKFVTLDEYYGANKEDKRSLRYFLDSNLFNLLQVSKKQITYIDDYKTNLKKFDSLLKKKRTDIQLLGLGKNGHIGFNEPGSKIDSNSRKIKLSQLTTKDKKIPFSHALTTGLAKILASKKVILIASGKGKANIINEIFSSPITSKIPATFLLNKKDLTILLDKDAASSLKIKMKNIK